MGDTKRKKNKYSGKPDQNTHDDMVTTLEATESKSSSGANFLKCMTPDRLAILVFSIFLAVGFIVVNDYGISIDEPIEAATSYYNYVYVMRTIMKSSESEAVREMADSYSDLMTWDDRFYGTFLQCVSVAVEHLNGFEMSSRDVFLMRHTFTFLNFIAGGIFFYLILRQRFGRTYIPVLGILFYILYPRFFGESFYNIKDILFFSWFVISAYFSLRWLKDSKVRFLVPAAATLAVATNTRILGLSLVLLTCVFSVIKDIWTKSGVKRVILKPIALISLTYIFYVAITPFLWENPLKNSAETFIHFIKFQNWDGLHLYLGEMISREVPWHYIPVWMGVTVPILYIVMFFVGVTGFCYKIIKYIKSRCDYFKSLRNQSSHEKSKVGCYTQPNMRHQNSGVRSQKSELIPETRKQSSITCLFDLYFFALFFCTLFGYMIFRINMYEGWRHAYSIFCPFLFISVYGLKCSFDFFHTKHTAIRIGYAFVIVSCLGSQLAWIVINHPYQYVYFNTIGRRFAEKNFSLDYWEVSHLDLIKGILENDNSLQVLIGGDAYLEKNGELLTDDERARIVWGCKNGPEYYLLNTRIPYENRTPPEGYTKLKSIIVDGMEISKVYTPNVMFDESAYSRIVAFNSNTNTDSWREMFDGDYNTGWSTDRFQLEEDYMVFEFDEPVDYDYISLVLAGDKVDDYPACLVVYISTDGTHLTNVPIVDDCRLILDSQSYRYLVLMTEEYDYAPWSVCELRFGHSAAENHIDRS